MATVPQARAREHAVRVRVRLPAALGQAPEVSPEAGRLLGRDLGAGHGVPGQDSAVHRLRERASSGRRENRRFSPTRVSERAETMPRLQGQARDPGAAPGAPRERVETTAACAVCGEETTVPFKPDAGRPVLCRACFQQRKAPARRASERSAATAARTLTVSILRVSVRLPLASDADGRGVGRCGRAVGGLQDFAA